MPPRSPALILLAEDNLLNRKIVFLQLKDLPVAVTEAVNGRQAVEEAARERFDLILMDLQMPIMDGLEATRRIRDHEREGARAPAPIYALTAHDSHADRQACLAAGCTGFLSKPISRRAIQDLLAGQIPPIPFPGLPPSLNPDLADLAPVFLKLTRAETRDMKLALERGDFATLARLGHGLKGAAASYGLTELSKIGAAVETGALAMPPAPELAGWIEAIQPHLRALAALCGE